MQIFKNIFIAIALLCNGMATVAAQTYGDKALDEAQSARSERPTLKTNAMMIGVGATCDNARSNRCEETGAYTIPRTGK